MSALSPLTSVAPTLTVSTLPPLLLALPSSLMTTLALAILDGPETFLLSTLEILQRIRSLTRRIVLLLRKAAFTVPSLALSHLTIYRFA